MASPVVSPVVSAAPESSIPPAATSSLWPADLSRWYLPEEDDDVGISYQTWLVLRALLSSMEQWAKEEGKAWLVGSEQDMLLREDDLRVGVRPDAYLLPCIPEDLTFERWPAYQEGMPVPVLAVELVSPSNWEKDYKEASEKYTVLGVEELFLVDLLAADGKSPAKGAEVFQLYRKGRGGRLERVYAGPGPVRSEVMGVWWREEGGEIHLTRDKQGNERILTKEEAEREKRGIAENVRRVTEEKAKEEVNARRIAEEKAKEAEKKAKEEANARRVAEEKAKEEANARRVAEEKAKEEANARRVAEEKAKEEANARRVAEEKAKEEADARRVAEEKTKEAADAIRVAEKKAKEEADARRVAEKKAKEEVNARQIAEEKAKEAEKKAKEAKEKAKEESEARCQAEEKAKEAEANALREAIFDLCELLSIELTEAQRAQVEAMDLTELRELRTTLKQQKRWPG
jgi:Uma2 family endonuclease